MIVVPLYLDTLLNLSTVLKYERMVMMLLYLEKLLNLSTIIFAQIVEPFTLSKDEPMIVVSLQAVRCYRIKSDALAVPF